MTTRRIERAIVCAGFVALSMWLVGQTALAKPNVVECDKGKSIQAAVDKVSFGVSVVITIEGTCTEDVTITKDDVTLEGDATVGGTVNGTITINGAQRVAIRDLKVTGSGSGVIGTDNASFTVEVSEIVENDEDGIAVLRNSRARIFDSDIKDNGKAGLASGAGGPGYGVLVSASGSANISSNDIIDNRADGVGVFNGAFARIVDNDIEGNGRAAVFEAGVQVSRAVVRADGNRYKDNPYVAIEVFNDGSYRTGTFLTAADNPDNLFPFEVIDKGTGMMAVELGRMALADLRQVTVTGDISVGNHSVLQIRGDNVGTEVCSTVNGNINAFGIFSVIRLRNVDVTGVVNVGADSRQSVSSDCSP